VGAAPVPGRRGARWIPEGRAAAAVEALAREGIEETYLRSREEREDTCRVRGHGGVGEGKYIINMYIYIW